MWEYNSNPQQYDQRLAITLMMIFGRVVPEQIIVYKREDMQDRTKTPTGIGISACPHFFRQQAHILRVSSHISHILLSPRARRVRLSAVLFDAGCPLKRTRCYFLLWKRLRYVLTYFFFLLPVQPFVCKVYGEKKNMEFFFIYRFNRHDLP